MMMIEH